MTTPLVLTFVGRDRPGLVNAIAERVAGAGGTWLESRLVRLAGEFAGVVLVAAPSERLIRLSIVGAERPGIVRDVTQALTRLGVNIEEFVSGVEGEPFTGAELFRAALRIRLPDGLAVDELRKTLERLAGEIMVDLSVGEEAPVG